MIVDTSALVAIALDEPERLEFQELIVDSTTPRLSAANLVELFIVVDRHTNRSVSDRIDTLLGALGLVIEPVTAEQALIARGLPPFRTGQRAPGTAELWRLLRLCAGEVARRTAALQG